MKDMAYFPFWEYVIYLLVMFKEKKMVENSFCSLSFGRFDVIHLYVLTLKLLSKSPTSLLSACWVDPDVGMFIPNDSQCSAVWQQEFWDIQNF
jgi:hypothetical protein